MLSLTDKLDSTLVVTGVGELPVNLAYNTVLKWYSIGEDKRMQIVDKIRVGWQLFFNGVVLDFGSADDYEVASRAISELLEYINEDPYNVPDDANSSSAPSPEVFSYSQDAEAIYASFIYDYGIDLIEERDKMRWEKFRALFNNLSPNSPFRRIVEIRQSDTSGLKGEELVKLTEAQTYYRLKGQSTSQVDDAIGAMFSMLATQAKQNQ